MTKKTFPLLFLFFILNLKIFFAQSDACTVTWGPEMEIEQYENVTGLLAQDEDYYYITSTKEAAFEKSGTYIKKIDHKLSLAASGFIMDEYKESGQDFHTEKIIFFNGNFFLFSSITDKKKKEYVLFWKKIDKATLTPSGSFIRMFATSYTEPRRVNRYRFAISPDDKKMLVTITVSGLKRDDRLKQHVYIYNQNIEEQWNKLIANDNPNLNLGYIYRIDNNGNIYNKHVTTRQ